MRFGLQTYGTTGDVRPLVALAAGLRAAGHEVVLTAASVDNVDHSALCAALGVEYVRLAYPMPFDIFAFTRRISAVADPLRHVAMLYQESLYPHFDEMYAAAEELCACSDVLIGLYAAFPLKIAARKAGKPCVQVFLSRAMIPSAYQPPFGARLGRPVHRLLWLAVGRAVDARLKADMNRFWQRAGLPPVADVLTGVWQSERLNLLAASPLFGDLLPDQQDRFRACGAFNMPAGAEPWEMPADLERFLAAGEPPVYMTLGSVSRHTPDEARALLRETARLAGCRAVIQAGGDHPPGADGEVYYLGRAAHDQVFPRCAAVLHHGAPGTAQSVCRAGRPSILLPFLYEHALWGRELYRLGIAARPIPSRRATPERLARAVRAVLADRDLGRRAAEVGARLSTEDGVRRAVEILDRELAAPVH